MQRLVLFVLCLLVALPAAAQEAETSIDLSGIKLYAQENASLMKDGTSTFLADVQAYYDLVASYDFDYEVAWEADSAALTELLMQARESWFVASVQYELNEGIVAGTPSLSYFDALLDAGPSRADDPETALDWTLELPDGTVLDSPGNLFSLSEPALYGTIPGFVALDVDLDGDGTVAFTEALPDANLLLGLAQRLDIEAQNLIDSIDAWQPTPSDAFTALIVMTPTMSEYFGQWKESVFVAGEDAQQTTFIATSRLADILSILNGLDVTYDNITPLIAEANPELNDQISTGFSGLVAFVQDIHDDETAGIRFEAEEADLLGTEAQNQAETLAALVAQAADELGIEVVLE
jgi:hypothetical protein